MLKNNGNGNIAIGYNTGVELLNGSYNIIIGTETAVNLQSGSSNVFIGKINVNPFPTTSFLAGNDLSSSIILADGNGNQRHQWTRLRENCRSHQKSLWQPDTRRENPPVSYPAANQAADKRKIVLS